MLSRDQLLQGLRARTKTVVIDGLGEVCVSEVTVQRRVALLTIARENMDGVAAFDADQALPADERTGVAKVEKIDHALLTIMHSVVDEKGDLTFTMEDYPLLQSWGYDVTVKLWEAVVAISTDYSNEAVEAKKKNSVTSRKSASHSASRKALVEQ